MMSTDAAVTSVSQVEDAAYTNDRPVDHEGQLQSSTSPLQDHGHVNTDIFLVLLVLIIFGIIANVAMLISLLVYKRAARKTINVFICNQTILDVAATSISAVKLALLMSGYQQTKTGVLRIS